MIPRRFKVTYYLRSGDRVTFRCDDLERTSQNNDLVAVTVTRGRGQPRYTRLDAIEMIVIRRSFWRLLL